MLYGEFMNFGDGVTHILELNDVETWADSVIDFTPGPTVFGCDFAAGGDDNVIVKRVGNKVKEITAWKDKDTANASGRFVRELRRMGYQEKRNMSVFGDATGIGRTMCDLIRESGIGINDFNFGGHTNDLAFRDEGTRVWYTVAKAIKSGKIVCPDRHHETVKRLFAQLTSRRQKAHSSGKLWMESKAEMAARGIKSPDVADAFVVAFGVQPLMAYSWMPYDDSGRSEIARKRGWEYSGSEEEARKAMYGEAGRSDDESGANSSPSGFGGVHSTW